ncbi:hypothetical protein [Peribacillus frigoritolerans]|uniref:hypothetical protein n=1 Tax=Peribacillus frigoritolerans TaxID=450367 RepID=UPI002E9FA565|nr:hypothetical protein [Peribacillus frigoritolerans]
MAQFFYLTFQLIPEIRSLSADCLPSRIKASACGVSASQFFSRSVAYFFHPMRITGEKNLKDKLVSNIIRYEISLQFFLEIITADFSIPLPSADWLPSRIKASDCGISASQYFGRSVAYFFLPMRIIGKKNLMDKLV